MNHSLLVWVRPWGTTSNESLSACLSKNLGPDLKWITPYLSEWLKWNNPHLSEKEGRAWLESLPTCQSKVGAGFTWIIHSLFVNQKQDLTTWITAYLSIKSRAGLVLNHSLLVSQKQGLTWLESLPTCQSKARPDLTWITPYLSIKSRAWPEMNPSLLFNQKGQETSQLIGSSCLFINLTILN